MNPEETCPPIRFTKPIKQFYVPGKDDLTLVFESRFESGNLDTVYKVSDFEYNLLLQNDINTRGNTQWFFFKTLNTFKDLTVKFNIVNLGKSGSLYNEGMQVLVFSEQSEKNQQKLWHRAGSSISYTKNKLTKSNGRSYYTLSFTYTFGYSQDVVYFAYSCPYTYTDLMKYLLSLENNHQRQNFISRKSLCKTISGNRCECLTITDSDIPENIKNRKAVFISARVHPGETVSSWMMHGLIDFLTGPSNEAAILREKFVFKLIPMLNPDGVINGNYRTNLAGCDLNRKWKAPSKIIHPTIFHLKKLMKTVMSEREIVLVCDLHGHSRSMGLFAYGCTNFSFPEETRVFPLIMSRVSKPFEYEFCSFKMQKSKESTLRITVFKELGISNVFTLESSFCGNKGVHFGVEELMEIGKDVCLTLFKYTEDKFCKELCCEELKKKPELMKDSTLEVTDSDSDPSEDELEPEILAQMLPKLKIRRKNVSKLKRYSKISVKKSFSAPRQRENITPKLEIRLAPIEKPREIKKCEICGEGLLPGHNCLRKIQKNLSPTPAIHQRKVVKSLSAIHTELIYTNAKGKQVRDQASQTVYIRRILDSDTFNVINDTSPDRRRPGKECSTNFPVAKKQQLSHIASVLDINGKRFNMNV